MLIEQIRYYFDEDNRDAVLDARREESRIRADLRIPAGVILLPDESPAEKPFIAWQCGYGDESEMGNAEQALLGSEGYREVRNRIAGLATTVEVELYVTDED